MKERVFWSFLALSTLAAAIFGYHRFQQIRPVVLVQDPASAEAALQQRLERIEAYQERTRAQAWGRAQPQPQALEPQVLEPGQRCVDGFVVEVRASAEGSVITRVERDGQPAPCRND
jgi:hypothetical protein